MSNYDFTQPEQREFSTEINPETRILSYSQAAKRQLLKMARKGHAPTTGIPALDRYIKAFLPGSITVLSAESSVGKTTFAANIAANVAFQQNKTVLFFSLESGTSVAEMIACYILRKPETQLTEQDRFQDIKTLKIVAPEEQLTLGDVEKLCLEYDADLVILDHIHYLLHSAENISSSVATTVRGLQTLARRLNTHFLIISHLKKPEAGRENDLPTIYRLKDSSALYQDPSNVILIHRKRKSLEFLTPGEDVFECTGIIIVAKNRDFGSTGIARFTLNKELHSFDF